MKKFSVNLYSFFVNAHIMIGLKFEQPIRMLKNELSFIGPIPYLPPSPTLGISINHRERKYTTPLALFMGCGVVERHLEMAQPTKKPNIERT